MKRTEYRRRQRKDGGSRIFMRLVVICICAVAIYRILPLEKEQGANESGAMRPEESGEPFGTAQESRGPGVNQGTAVFGEDEKIYRILSGTLETEKGTYVLEADAALWVDGVPVKEKAGNFLTGKRAVLHQEENGRVDGISVQGAIETPEKMRVLLSNGVDGYEHHTIEISCDTKFWALWDGQIITYPAGSELTVKWEENAIQRRTCFYAASEKALFTVTSGEAGTHSYYGSIEVAKEENGYSLINEVDLETYLCGVVPAEMPESYGVEAAKTQAVCARSYACNQWKNSKKYESYGAHVDNTVNSQCYNGAVSQGVAVQGVEATWGQVLTYEEAIIPANYFSTSCGWTAAAADVWNGTGSMTYLSAKAQYTEGDYGDLSQEENFHAFITDTQVPAFDQESRWFRWTAKVNGEQVREKLDQYLASVNTVKVLEEDFFEEKKLDTMGEVKDFYVYTRAESGLATSLLIVGTEASVKIEGAQAIRQILSGAAITLSSGENIGTRSLLPSAFISLEKIKDTEGETVSVKICGGGYGHGTGLSQTGVYGMTEQGYTYEEILAHYYEGTTLTDTP